MATIAAVFSPDVSISVGSSLVGPGGDSGVILIGTNRLFRVWTDNTSGLSIAFGKGSVASPTSANYSIGVTPQDFDLGGSLDSIRLVNNSNISSAHYFLQVLSKN